MAEPSIHPHHRYHQATQHWLIFRIVNKRKEKFYFARVTPLKLCTVYAKHILSALVRLDFLMMLNADWILRKQFAVIKWVWVLVFAVATRQNENKKKTSSKHYRLHLLREFLHQTLFNKTLCIPRAALSVAFFVCILWSALSTVDSLQDIIRPRFAPASHIFPILQDIFLFRTHLYTLNHVTPTA